MKKTLLMALVLVLALSQAVGAAFYPRDGVGFCSGFKTGFSKADEITNGYFTVAEGTTYTKSFSQDNAAIDGLKFVSISDNGFYCNEFLKIPAATAAISAADNTDRTYYNEITVDMSKLSSQVRFYVRNSADKSVYAIRMTKASVQINLEDNSGSRVGDAYAIPAADQDKEIKIGVAYRPYFAASQAAFSMYVNDACVVPGTGIYYTNKRLPDGRAYFYGFNQTKGEEFIVKSFKTYHSEPGANVLDSIPTSLASMTKDADISLTEESSANGTVEYAPAKDTDFTVTNNVEETPGMVLTATEEGGLPGFDIVGGSPNKLYWGTNAAYTHYWELTAKIDELKEYDSYRFEVYGKGPTNTNKAIATLSFGRRDLDFGYKGDVTSSKAGYAGSYQIPQELVNEPVRLGISYNPANYEIKAYVNGEAVISAQSDVYAADLANTYPDGGPIKFYNMGRDASGSKFTVLDFMGGYIKTESIQPEGTLTSTTPQVNIEGENVTVTAALTKNGSLGYVDRATYLVAVYDNANLIKSLATATKVVESGGTDGDVSLSVGGYTEGCTVKAFVWNLNKLTPVQIAD